MLYSNQMLLLQNIFSYDNKDVNKAFLLCLNPRCENKTLCANLFVSVNMSVPEGDPLVLVTGASGFLATHMVKQLQEKGYRVRGTVRSLQNETKVKPIRNLCPDARVPLELVKADLTKEEDWIDAVKGCTYVLHTASPLPADMPDDENEIIKPAVDGTVYVLDACRKAGGVKRVVITSSIAAVSGQLVDKPDYMHTEKDWTDLTFNIDKLSAYRKSKTIAEKAAWDFMKELTEEEKFELVVLNPGYVFGPVLCGSLAAIMEIPKHLLEHSVPAIPYVHLPSVDVRDCAVAHINALTAPSAVGHRHILVSDHMWMPEIAEIIKNEFQPQGYNVPTRTVPYFLLKIGSFFDKRVKRLLPTVGVTMNFDNTRMKEELGLKQTYSAKQSILDMCYSMIELGFIKKTPKYTPRDG